MAGLRHVARLAAACFALSWAGSGLHAQCDARAAPLPTEPDGVEALTLSQIQGPQASSPWAGQWVRSAGVVTLVVPGGAYLQDPSGDGDPQTSDAVYVSLKPGHGWRAGQWWQLTARVEEWPVAGPRKPGPQPTRTVLAQMRALALLGDGCAVLAPSLVLPLPPELPASALESMLVEVLGPLTVGQVQQASATQRLWVSAGLRDRVATDQAMPGIAALERSAEAATRRLSVRLDAQTTVIAPQMPVSHRPWRGGQVLAMVRGVQDSRVGFMAPGVGALQLVATQLSLAAQNAERSPAPPPPSAGQLRVAGVNLHNFFTSLSVAQTEALEDPEDDPSTGCRQGRQQAWRWCRGAGDWSDYQRQRDKLVDLVLALQADVVGVMEVQNNQGRALQALVDALNARLGEPEWAAVPPVAQGAGLDAVAVGLLYRPARLRPVGPARSDMPTVHHRPPLAQTFRTTEGAEFLMVVNHFKSRQCLRAKGADQDQEDGQGCFNDRRWRQARALHRFVEEMQRHGVPQAALLLGDFNAHTFEAPLLHLRRQGWQDVLTRYAPGGWSFAWRGQVGRLDHVLASPALAPAVKAAGEWHVNTDEPPQSARLSGPWRASDHDPVWVDLALPPPLR